jgi:hypothetical protein
MTDPIRAALIEEIAKLCADADGIVAYAPAIVDALGLVTDRKARILLHDGDLFREGDRWEWWVRGEGLGRFEGSEDFKVAVAAAWKARGS